MFIWLFLCLQLLLLPTTTLPKESIPNPNANTSCIEKERQALLAFKSGLIDPGHYLSSWRSEDKDCCRWVGIHCSLKTGHVTALDLSPNVIDTFSLDGTFIFLSGKISPSLLNLSHLSYLDLSYQDFSGFPSLLEFIGSMTSLEHLNLSSNALGGEIPVSWGNLCKLLTLNLSHNNFNGTLDVLIRNWSRCPRGHFLRELCVSSNQLTGHFNFINLPFYSHLEVLDLSANKLNGSLPNDIWKLVNLSVLKISENAFSGILPQTIGNLSNLTILDVHSNFLHGEISDNHILGLPKLRGLDLCLNSFKINLSLNFVPPFQLTTLRLCSIDLGPKFPNWISTQKYLFHLDISKSRISDVAPSWLGDVCRSLLYFNISHNQVSGMAPNFPSGRSIDLRSNLFEGPLPQFSDMASFLLLSQNKFSGNIHFLCAQDFIYLSILDLSNNILSGVLPDCYSNSYFLDILDLSDNDFHGTIPFSIATMPTLLSLSLSNNKLVGKLPSFFSSTELKILDVANNQLYGNIPTGINGSLANLIVLKLQSNRFSGEIPTGLCQLNNIQILDLSLNNLSGGIPTCLNKLVKMAQTRNKRRETRITFSIEEGNMPLVDNVFSASVTWKGMKDTNEKLLALLNLIDFSSNKLSGEIPAQLASLVGLISLNLSRNELTGLIPAMIGQLQELDVLDLSNKA